MGSFNLLRFDSDSDLVYMEDFVRGHMTADPGNVDCVHLPLRADRSPAYAPDGRRDPTLDEAHDVMAEWLAASEAQVCD
jgi:hypothetical protein